MYPSWLTDVFADDVQHHRRVGQNCLVAFDLLDDRGIFADEFFQFQTHELNELQPPDGFRLDLREAHRLERGAIKKRLGNLRRRRMIGGNAKGPLAQFADGFVARLA
jgi:hypothetical protein